MTKITEERLRELIHYDPETGVLTQVAVRKGWERGRVIGRLRKHDGYIRIGVDMKRYLAHRIIWLYMTGRWPENQIDHINGNRSDNRWCNLREATNAQNGKNRGPEKGNTYGLKGVAKTNDHWRTKPFTAKITVDGKHHYLGRFETADLAHEAYAVAAQQLHGNFARTR